MIEPKSVIDILANEPLPHLAAALRARKERIQVRWEEAVRAALPDADPLTRREVRDSLPVVLEQLAKALESADPEEARELRRITGHHGATRFHQSYNVDELISECRLLRRVVVEEVKAALGRDLSSTEVMALDTGVDIALHRSVVEFVGHQNTQIQEAAQIQSRYTSPSSPTTSATTSTE